MTTVYGDAGIDSVAVPFPLWVGERFIPAGTKLRVRADGYAYFGPVTGAPNYSYNAYNSTSATYTSMTTFVPYLCTDGGMTQGSSAVYWKADETDDGDSVLIVEFQHVNRYNQSSSTDFNYQIRLYANGNISYTYGTMTNNLSTLTETGAFIAAGAGDRICISGTWAAPTIISPSTLSYVSGTPASGTVFTFSRPTTFCARPVLLTLVDTSTTTATVAWSVLESVTGFAYEYGTQPFVPGAGLHNAGTTTDTSAFLTGLTPSSHYYFYVRSICSGDSSSWVPLDFYTQCDVIPHSELPIVETFASYSTGTSSQLHPCWTKYSFTTTATYPYVSTTAPTGGTANSLYFYPTSGNSQWVVLPAVDNVSDLLVTFLYRSSSAAATLTMGVMTNPTDTTTFTALQTFQVSTTNTFEFFESNPLSSYTGTGQHIAFRAKGSGTSAASIYLDDITVMVAPSCNRLQSVAASGITSSSVDIHIADPDGTANYAIALFAGNTPVDTIYTSDTVYTIDNLETNTEYSATVWSICGDGNPTSARTVNFRTACGNITTLPWTEDFDDWTASSSQTTSDPCWDHLGTGYANIITTASNVVSGKGMRFYPNNVAGNHIEVLPPFEADLGTLEVSFWHRPEGSSSGKFSVGYITDVSDTASFVALDNFVVADFAQTSVFMQSIVSFVGLTIPDGARIAFRYYPTSTSWYWFLDDVAVYVGPSCARAQGIAIEGVAATEATILILDTNHVGNYEVSLVNLDDATADTVIYTLTDTTHALTTLTANTNYRVIMSTLCSDGTRTLPRTTDFRTACEPILADSLPWSENFDSYTGGTSATATSRMDISCWAFPRRNSTNHPYLSSSATYNPGGGNCVYSISSATAPSMVVLPAFENAPEELMLSIDIYIAAATGGLEIGVIDNPMDYTTFTPVTTCRPTSLSNWQSFDVTFAGHSSGYIAILFTGNTYFDNVVVDHLPSCVTPSSVSVSDITSTSATINIADPNSTTHYVVEVTGGDSPEEHEIFTDAYSLTGLSPNTPYYISVATLCASGDTTEALALSFRTACETPTIPYHEDFDSYEDLYTTMTGGLSGTDMIPCWRYFPHATAARMSLTASGSYLYGGAGYSLLFYPGAAGKRNYITLPQFSEEIADLELSFWTRPEGTSASPGSFDVGYLTDPDDTSTFVSVQHINNFSGTANSDYIEVIVNFLNAPAGSVIAMVHNTNASNYYWFIDEVDVHLLPACLRPDGISVDNITTTTAQLHIDDPTGVGHYRYFLTSSDGDSEAIDIYDIVYDITDLSPSTDYTITVMSVCPDGTTTAPHTAAISTLCAPVSTLPFIETFEGWATGAANADRCWDRYYKTSSSTSTTSYPYASTSANAYEGSKYLSFYTYSTNYSVAFLPEFEEPVNQLYLSFMAKANSASYYAGQRIAVGVSSSTGDTSTFTRLATFAMTDNEWNFYDVDFSEYTDTGNRITIILYGTTANYITSWVDSIVVDTLGSCPRPATFTVTGLSDTSVSLAWTDPNLIGSYDLTWGDQSVTVNDLTYTITGLSPQTDYTIRLSSSCNPTHFRTVSFTTACSAIASLPWNEDFNSYTGGTSGSATTNINNMPCWEFSGFNANTSYFTTAYNHDGQASGNAIRYYGNTSTYPCFMSFPLFSSDLSSMMLSFWMYSASANAYVGVGYLSNPADPTSYTEVAQCRVSATNTWEYKDVFFPAEAAGRITMRYYGSSNNIYLDDFTVDLVPTCIYPSSVDVTNITDSSATVTITDQNGADHYCLVLRAGATVIDSTVITSNTHTYTTLNPSTEYSLSVRTVCDDGTLTRAVTASFATQCGAINLPWLETFDSWSSKSPCWSFLSGNYNGAAGPAATSTSAWTLNTTYGTHIAIDGKALTMNLYSTLKYWAVTPVINIDSDSALLSVSVAVAAWSASTPNFDGNDTLAFAISTDGGTTFTNLHILDQTALNALGNTFTTIQVPVIGYNGQQVRFAIFGGSISGSNPYDNRVAIDSVSVTATGSVAPQPVTTYTVSVGTADQAMGSATVSPSGTVNAGTSVTFTATANQGYTFVQWNDASGAAVSTDNPYTTTVNQNLALTATFQASGTPQPTCAAPTGVTASAITAESATVSWTAGGDETQWQVDCNGTVVGTTDNPYTLTGLEAATSYSVKVRAICDAATQLYSDWSASYSFSTLVGIEAADGTQIMLYPNPATTTVTLEGIEGAAKVALVDISGRTAGVWTVESGELTIDVAGLAKGAYFVRVTGEQVNAIRKLIVK